MTPHVHRALDLGFRFAGLHIRARGKLEALNCLGFAVAGLDLDGSIAFMNQRAEEILTSNDGLAIRHQCIVAANHDDNEAFWRLIRNTIGARSKNARSPGGAVTVRRPAGRTLSEYAEAATLSMHTVRWTLKHVFAKTDTRRQAELVRLRLTSAAADIDLPTENETGTTPI